MGAQREFADQRATLFYFREKLLIFFRIDHVDSGTKHSHRRTPRSPASALMRQAVDAPSHAADNRQATRSEVVPQPLRHLIAIRRRAARPYHRDGMAV